jgi:hypothetical protein
MLSCGDFHIMYTTALVKRAVTMPGFIHDRQNLNDGTMEEFRSAISHTKECKAACNAATYILNPLHVLFLFKKMLDEVHFYSHFHFINFCMIFLFLVQECGVLTILK